MKPCIGLIAPALEQGGGVPAVARFVKNTVSSSGCYDLRIISLSTSAQDETSVCLARPNYWGRGVTTRRTQWQGVPLLHVGAGIGELEFQRYRPRKALTEAVADCDILQVVCGTPAWAYAVSGLGKPVSVQCATRAKVERRRRDANPVGVADWWRKAMTEITDRIEERALRSVDAIQVENSWMYDHARKLNEYREVDLRFAPPGIDARTFRPARQRNLDCDPYVLCVGRFDDPRKNISLLLDAYALISDRIRNRLRLVLAGMAGPPDSFWQRAEVLRLRHRIEFFDCPSSEELVSLYQHASMFALPSDEEGLGVVLLEAMACGIPVVSTRSGGPDGIITDSEDGYLVPLDDAAALADKIARLHLDQRLNREIGERARVTIERSYAEEVAGQVFLDIWHRLLHKAGKA